MSLRTVIYIRKSSKDKDENHQKLSIPRQKHDIEEFLKRHNAIVQPEEHLRIVNPTQDIVKEDASAKIPNNRPEFTKMIERIHKGKYDVLLCTELSRLSRNAMDTGTLVQVLEDKNIRKIMTLDKVFTTIPTDKFTLALFLSVSKFENDQRALNTHSGMAHQKERGVTTHRAPMGYKNVGNKKGQKGVESDGMTWDSIRMLWEMMMTGDFSIADIHEEGEHMHVTYIRNGKRYSPSITAYTYMFRNRYYTGKVVIRNQETGEERWKKGEHPAMVSDEEFEKVQLILQSRGYRHQHVAKAPSIEVILNEILVCGKCMTIVNGTTRPTKMTFEEKTRYTCARCKHRYSSAVSKPCPKCQEPVTSATKTDSHRYYRCGKKQSSLACSHDFYGTGDSTKNVSAGEIETYLDSHLSRLHITEGLFRVLSRQLFTLWLEADEVLKRKEDDIEVRKKELNEERLKLRKKAMTDEDLSTAERQDLDSLLDENKDKDEALDEELAKLRNEEEEKFEKAWQSMNALREAKSVFGSPDLEIEPIRRLVLSMVSNLTISDKKWTINWKKPFDTVAKASIAKKDRPNSGNKSGGGKLNWLPRLDSNQQPWR